MIGVYDNERRVKQLLKFDGMTIGRKCFTDFDAVMEYDNRAWLVFEAKYGNKDVPYGQRLALERFVRDMHRAGKDAVAVVVQHNVSDPRRSVFLKDCNVRQVYMSGELSWRPPKRRMSARQFMVEYIDYVEGRK